MSLVFEISSTYTSRQIFIGTVKRIVTFWRVGATPILANLLNRRVEFGNSQNSNSSVSSLVLKSMKCPHLEFFDSRHKTSDTTNRLLLKSYSNQRKDAT